MLLEEAHSNAASEHQPRDLLPLMRQSARLLYTPLRPARSLTKVLAQTIFLSAN
jgi:hypothetical protein